MKTKTEYVCSNCDSRFLTWSGKCPTCEMWGTIEEREVVKADKNSMVAKADPEKIDVRKLKDIQVGECERYVSGIGEFDRVLGGGLVKDSLSILTAKPGSGKSTLLLELAYAYGGLGHKILYISGEESASQIKDRALRIMEDISPNIWILSTNSMDEARASVGKIDPDIMFFDSIQTLSLAEYSSRAGSPIQTVECTNEILGLCKSATRPRASIMIGHMTKTDEMAGLRTLEHMVDTVLYLESDMEEDLRILSSTKNRFGSTGEIGIFRMGENGLKEVSDPSKEFITSRIEDVPGSALALVKEGTRHIAVEVESLVSTSFQAYPIRIGDSLKKDRLNTLVAILEQRAGIRLYDKNVVIKTTGGLALRQQDSDLAILISIVSSVLDRPVPKGHIFLAEVGLTGELKSIRQLDQRLEELKRLGYTDVFYYGRGGSTEEDGFRRHPRKNLREVIDQVFQPNKTS